ncbi:MAG: hypothetical protein HYZ53_18190 [Planctomycetes bacterium]|nr:hypothetical protein [Planctomycetota bacterium]
MGFPAGRELRLIRVSFEQPGDQPGSWENADPIEGFLVSEDENSIRVFSYQLTVVTVSKGDPGSSDSRHATYAVLDFAREVDPDPSHPFQFVTPTFFGESVSVNEKMLSLARASARVGKVGIERRLLSGCLGECDLDWTGKRSECFFDLLVDGLGYHMAQQAVLLECCPRASHRQALDYVSVLARAFPAGKWRKRFKQDAEVLERMVLEEETTHTRSSKPLNELPVEERVAELIFSLRDAAVGDSWPHSNWIFSEADVDGALTDLVELGPPAVPQLIEAVGDASFTRTVQTRHSLFTSWTEVRVGDLTVRVLESIAKRPFCSPSNTLATMFTDGDVGGTLTG